MTVTRGTDPWTLCNGVRERMGRWLRSGATTIEAKTGYHLTRDGELADVRMLRGLEGEPGMPRVHVTFLAAHAVPPEFFGRRTDYIDAVSSWCADAAAVGADSVDVYCEEGGFSEEEARWILNAGRRSGLLPRMHACGDSRTGAARLAAEIGCASADMLHDANDDDVACWPGQASPPWCARARPCRSAPARRCAPCSTRALPSRSAPTTPPAATGSPRWRS